MNDDGKLNLCKVFFISGFALFPLFCGLMVLFKEAFCKLYSMRGNSKFTPVSSVL